jgi:uncharacterized membrane protein YccC
MAADAKTDSWQLALGQGLLAALVALFAYATARLVPWLREPYWAAIAAIVVLYPDREATQKAASQRFIGTVIGSLIGWVTATYWHEHVVVYGVAIVVAVGVCYVLRLENASRLCAVAVTVITIVPHAGPARWIALERFAEVSYGVGCALAFAVLVDLARKRWRQRGDR